MFGKIGKSVLGKIVFGGEQKLAKFCEIPERIPESQDVNVHMLWVEGELSNLERLSCSSFVENGYKVRLWTYGGMRHVPPGVELFDAREILPSDRIFKYENGSFAGFSNLFRYSVLSAKGGMWSDLDVVCMLSAEELRRKSLDSFCVTEHRKDGHLHRLNNNLIYVPKPTRGDIVDIALAVSERYDVGKLRWGDCGPRLLTVLARNYPAVVPTIMEPNFANPLPPKACPRALFRSDTCLPKGVGFLHCYNERWRRQGLDKNAPWPAKSLLGQLARRYLPELSHSSI